jgi:hypothetical protein
MKTIRISRFKASIQAAQAEAYNLTNFSAGWTYLAKRLESGSGMVDCDGIRIRQRDGKRESLGVSKINLG